MTRNKKIIKISILGILMNAFLVVIKLLIGLLSNSIVILLDALNNSSDILSSLITIIGTKLSLKKANKKHPYGFGRIEYFSATIVSIIILYAGLKALEESIIKIINPVATNYTFISLIVVVIGIFLKLFYGVYCKTEGENLKSNNLIATGQDSLNDSILSLSTLIAIVFKMVTNIGIEGYIGCLIAIIIIKSSLGILKNTIDDIVGTRINIDVIKDMKKIILSFDNVKGVYDINIHNYGPEKNIATVHIQVDDEMKAKDLHKLTRRIITKVYEELGIITTIGIYASNNEKKYLDLKEDIKKIIKKYKSIIQIHGFYVDEDTKTVSFDLLFNFEEDRQLEIVANIKKILYKKYPKYNFNVIIDVDYYS